MTARYGLAGLVAAALVLSACSRNKEDDIAFNGYYFVSRADRVSKDERDRFTVEVRKANQDLGAAREAGRYEGTKYCIDQYGTSVIEWVIGPETETIIPVDDTIQLEGICRP